MAQTLDSQPDLGLFREVLAYIDEHPREWDQGAYGHKRSDGTVCGCVAYHTLRLCGNYVDTDFEWYSSGDLVTIDANGEHIEDLAGRELGLTYEETEMLFDGDNDRERLQEIFEQIKKRVRRR